MKNVYGQYDKLHQVYLLIAWAENVKRSSCQVLQSQILLYAVQLCLNLWFQTFKPGIDQLTDLRFFYLGSSQLSCPCLRVTVVVSCCCVWCLWHIIHTHPLLICSRKLMCDKISWRERAGSEIDSWTALAKAEMLAILCLIPIRAI